MAGRYREDNRHRCVVDDEEDAVAEVKSLCIIGDGKGRKGGDRNGKKVKDPFNQHLSLEEALRLYADPPRSYVRERFRVSGLPGNYIKGFMSCDRVGLRQDLIILRLRDTNWALDGDVVFVDILDLITTEGEGGDGGGEAVAHDVDVDDNNNTDGDDHTDEDDSEDEDDISEELGDAIGGLNLDDGAEFDGTMCRYDNDVEEKGGKGEEDEADIGGGRLRRPSRCGAGTPPSVPSGTLPSTFPCTC